MTMQQLEGYGVTPEQFTTPEQEFFRFASQFQPGAARGAFYGQQDPLLARYRLQQPTYGGSFRDFLSAYPGTAAQGAPAVTPMNAAQLRNLATGIGGLTAMTDPQYFQYVDDPAAYAGTGSDVLGSMTPAQQAAYRQQYLTGGQGVNVGENVRNLVNLLALQRGEGQGRYGGAMGGAITSLVDELFNQYIGQNPANTAGSFLNWYLDRSNPTGTGRLSFNPPATT